MHHKPPLPTLTLTTAKSLRTTSTAAEIKLWYHLRARRLVGLKFRRQHPIPPYIADFYCSELRLVIEVDGPVHETQRAYDQHRDRVMAGLGLLVVRLTNQEVLRDPGGAARRVLEEGRRWAVARMQGSPVREG